MFEGFATIRSAVNGVELHVRTRGAGSPLLLIHGYPQTGAMWHAVAPSLAERFSVVVPDLRGYGASSKPHGDGSTTYSKRNMAQDLVELMRSLGHDRFAVAGHDRGGRVAYRLALDHPQRVTRLAVLDIVPTYSTFESIDWRRAMGTHHWFFLAQPEPIPETLIGGNPTFWMQSRLDAWAGPGFTFDKEALSEYTRAFADPAAIHASCEDYRAGATTDFDLDAADYGRRKITCPMLALWGERDGSNRRAGTLETWREWAADVRGRAVRSGHFLPEQAPAETLDELLRFFSES